MDFDIPTTGNDSCVDTVRALHQTIVTLRTALEKSHSEILELKSKNWANNTIEDTIRNLSIENHVLRQKVLNKYSDQHEQTIREEKPKKVKKKENKEQTHLKNVEELEKLQESEYDYTKVQISADNIRANKDTKSVEKNLLLDSEQSRKSKNHLSKSKTVCYSNIYEGDKQISTASCLKIKSIKNKKSEPLEKQNINLPTLGDHKLEESNWKEKKGAKPKQSLQFEEEVVNGDITASRRGSISDFVTEEQDFHEELNNVKEYVKCVNKSQELIEAKPVKQGKSFENLQETSKIKQIRNKSPSNKGIKRDATFIKSEYKVSDKHKINDNLPICRKSRRKSSILGEQVELALKQQYPDKDKNIYKASKGSDIDNTAEQESISDNIEQNDIIQDEILSIGDGEKNSVDTNEYIVCTVGEVKTEDSVENYENKTKYIETEIIEIGDDIQINEDIAQETNKNYEDTIRKEALEVNVIDVERNTEIQPESSTDYVKKEIEKTNPLHSQSKDILEQGSSNEDDSGTLKSLENSTDFSSQKNVEISVKIYKGSKKPIEIDIQTKKKTHRKKKEKTQLKMNDKSQNTSFEKEYGEAPTVNQISTLSTNDIQRTIDNALADNIVDNILQNEEVDDIELIFTTDDTKETDFKEELVPIDTYGETQLLQCPLSDYEEKLSAEASDRELEDDVFNDNFENENQENCNFQSQTYDFRRENSQIYNSKSDNSINHEDKSLKSYYSYQDSSFENKSLEKDESFDRFEEKTRIIETDISKIGIQDVEYNMGRRNTCPNPIQYRPIMHREALGRGLNSRKCRPILAHSNVVRKESGAQTDISALPGSSWRSESSLGHKVKVGENFTTLPSKFPHPGSRLRLSEKTVEARRVLLSDIGFTSMVPELSRSADHLCPPAVRAGAAGTSYGQFLRTTDLYSPAYTSQKFVWTTTTPSESSHTHSRYSSQYPLSSPPAPTRRCSAPVSPSKKTTVMKNTPSKVRFANGSLPELRGDWTATVDSGESTDSLVEEAEHFLRRSIDCLAPCKDVRFRSDIVKMSGVRRASAPEPARDNVPPQGWQPFLPRIPRDLHLDYWVKVISPEGRVRGGRVRYVGPLINQTESFVGVQLSTPDGHSDGTYNSRRYFNCEPYHGLFVPFKKIIMGWRP